VLDRYNFETDEALANPYPLYAAMRLEDPIYWHQGAGAWMLMRHSDIVAALRHPTISAMRLKGPREMQSIKWLINIDPPEHTRLRKLVHNHYINRVIDFFSTYVRDTVNMLIDRMIQNRKADLICDFAHPLSMMVMYKMLGISRENYDRMEVLINDFSAFTGGIGSAATLSNARAGYRGIRECIGYFRESLRQRIAHPTENDLLAAFASLVQDSVLTEDEAIGLCVEMTFAAAKNVINGIGNGVYALLTTPTQLQLLKENETLIGTAVEELLRYDSPVQATARTAQSEIEIGGKIIRQGQRILLFLGAANRDPAEFKDPDALDIRRQNNAHLAFGYGSHFCIGVHLARYEMQTAISVLLHRLPTIRLATNEITWKATAGYRGLTSLPVEWQESVCQHDLPLTPFTSSAETYTS
jgi:cytochrome P450